MRARKTSAAIAGALALGAGLTAAGLAVAQTNSLPSRYELQRQLENRGYTDVEIESMGRTLATVVVCSGGKRERLQVDRQLRARLLETLGDCGLGGSASGGFDPNRFDNSLGGSGGSYTGGYTSQPPATPPSPAFRAVSRDLGQMGFDDIVLEDEVQGEVSATACRADHQYRARYDASWVLNDLYRIGECPDAAPTTPPVSGGGSQAGSGAALGPRAIADRLFNDGYRRVFIDGERNGMVLSSACFGVRRFEMLVDRSGEIQARRAAGFCSLGEGDTEYVPPRPISEDLLQSDITLDPPLCQRVLNWLQFNRPITFESGSARLDPESEDLIRQMAAGVDRCGPVRILVEGHTDSISSDTANQALSEQRAESVARMLVRNGVASYAVTSAGFGEDHPIASNASAQGRAMNRRIELNLEWGRF